MEAPTSRRGPLIQVRRYGRRDFEAFCQETARGSSLCVGSRAIGKIDVDCKYRWKKSQWGVLGPESNPAGIVYMDITFHQPAGYNLERASIYITLSEDDSSYALAKSRQRHKQRRGQTFDSAYAVQFTDHYGPRYLTGTKSTLTETKSNKIVPTLGAMGFQLGGVGLETSTSRDSVGRWVFKGRVGQPKDGAGFRTLEWELSENSLEPIQDHRREYRTGFAFEHSQRPVYMRVEIDGKLRSRGRNLKHDVIKFSSHLTNHDESTLTRIDFGAGAPLVKKLDTLARGLNMAMEMENCQDSAVEVPGPKPVTFLPETLPQTSSGALAPDAGIVAELPKDLSDIDDDGIFDLLKEQARLANKQQPKRLQGAAIEDYRPPEMVSWDSSESLATTVVNPMNSTPSDAANDPTAQLLAIPAVLNFLWGLAVFLKWCNFFPVALETSSDGELEDKLVKQLEESDEDSRQAPPLAQVVPNNGGLRLLDTGDGNRQELEDIRARQLYPEQLRGRCD